MPDAFIIRGKDIAEETLARLAEEVKTLPTAPVLGIVLVGENPASLIYVRNKIKKAEQVGIKSRLFTFPADVEEAELAQHVFALSRNPLFNGILVQLPLPKHIDEQRIISAISPLKDVDGFTPENIGLLALRQEEGFVPCTPLGCMRLIKKFEPNLAGKDALVIGRSNIVGRPMAQMLLNENCTVTMAHSYTKDLAAKCRQADIVVAACGCPGLVKGDWIKPGAIVIDVGISYLSDKTIKGDVDFASASLVAGAITPVPKGVGPMTIAMLFENTVKAYKIQQDFAMMRQLQSELADEEEYNDEEDDGYDDDD